MIDTNVRQMNCCEQLVASQTELRAIVASMMPGCSAADIADVVQEANRAILRRAGEFDYRKPFMPLLATFARFQVMAWRKRHHGGVVVFDDELADKAAELWASESMPMGDPELLGKLKHCKELLNEQQRRLLDLRYQDGRSVARIAQDRRQTPNRVSVELYKIRTRLGDCIRRLCRLCDTSEGAPPEFEEVLARSLANPEAGTGAELVRTLRAEPGNCLMSIWLEQNWVDTLLAREAEILAGAREIPEQAGEVEPRFRPARIAAIGVLAVGLGLGVLAAVAFVGKSRGQASGGSVKGTAPVSSLATAASSVPGTNSPAAAGSPGTDSDSSVTGGTAATGTATNLSVVQAEEGHEMKTNLSMVVAVAASLAAVSVPAADYYVSPTGNDSNDGLSAETAFLTVDRAVTNGVAGDRVFVAPGDYSTISQWGAPVKGALIGTGATRGDVVIRSAGAYRTLRTASAAVVSNLTIVGNTLFKVDKGGTVEMTGGTIVDCVITGGTAYANASSLAGGNLYMSSGAQVLDCDIVGGIATNRGGNVYLDVGLISNCVIRGGAAVNATAGTAVYGGNLFIYNGVLRDSVVMGGTACRGGNIYVSNAAAEITGCTVSDGTASYDHAGNLFLANCGVVSNCTFTGGTSVKYAGSALVQSGCTIANCVFVGGQTVARGGNVWVQNGNLVDCVLSNGTCTTASDQYDGGGNVYFEQGTLTRCRIVGGAITNGNDRAGGIHVGGEDTYTKVLEDCLIQGNSQGGLRYWRNVALYNCSIVGNAGYGVYAYGARHQPVLNVAIFGNTNAAGTVVGWNGTVSTNATSLVASDDKRATSWLTASASDFVDTESGDYRLSDVSTLIDAGSLDNRGRASVLDLDGKPRLSGVIDIGCYEYQKPDMTVSLSVADGNTRAVVPCTFTFTAVALNPVGAVTYTYDFGDGSALVSTNVAMISHTYVTPGLYTVSVSAVDDVTTASFSRDDYIGAVGEVVYASPGNTGAAYPYATLGTAAATAKDAVAAAVSGCTVEFASGVYEQSEQLVLATNVTLRSASGCPDDVILRNTTTRSGAFRILYITAANAFVSGLTLENGRVTDADGGNLLMSAGCVSNCVIRNGSVTAGWNNGVDGGARVIGTGLLTHCVVTNNALNGDVTGGANIWYRSAGVGLSGSAKMQDCLVAYNVYTAPDDKISTGCGGVLTEGAQTLLNCTIVSNQVHGKVTSNFPGARLGWHAAVQNCVFAENYSTEVMTTCTDGTTGVVTTNYVGMLGDVVPGDAYVTACASDGETMLGVYATADKMFYRRKASDWWVPAPGGPLYDAGTTGDWTATDLDLAGKPRVFKRAVDIGCYESQLDPIGGFVIRICDSDLAVPLDWIQTNLSEPDRMSDATISNALVSAGSNGLSRWESYALGLDPNRAGSVVLCDARQDASASCVTFYAQNVAPATNAGISVSYVLEGLQNGSWVPLLTCASNTLPVVLSSATSCYRIRTDIVLK